MNLATAKFSGHQSFSLRNTWLTKGVLECAANPSIFREPDALLTLGVGKNMVDSIKYWCLATRVIEAHPERRYDQQPSRIGYRLFVDDGGWDPYLEDEGTLWLLHWLLATNAEFATTVYYAFNESSALVFSRASLEKAISRLATVLEVRASPNTLRRDVNVFIRSYAGGQLRSTATIEDRLDCPLAELGLLYEEPVGQVYAFARGPKDSLPNAIVGYALWDYARRRDGQSSLTFDELAYYPLGPGRVFKLDEPALAERLEQIAELTGGAWQLTETAGYRQMLMTQDLDPYSILDDYYHRAQEEAYVRG